MSLEFYLRELPLVVDQWTREVSDLSYTSRSRQEHDMLSPEMYIRSEITLPGQCALIPLIICFSVVYGRKSSFSLSD